MGITLKQNLSDKLANCDLTLYQTVARFYYVNNTFYSHLISDFTFSFYHLICKKISIKIIFTSSKSKTICKKIRSLFLYCNNKITLFKINKTNLNKKKYFEYFFL